jgi:nucleotide-binding universal stress UspA family protein
MEAIVFKHVLLPTDGTDHGVQAVTRGIEFARSVGARVTGLHVMTPFYLYTLDGVLVGDTEEDYERENRARAEQYLAEITTAAEKAAVPCEVTSVTADHPWREIIHVAQERGCDVIFMASHGRSGMAALLLGSETMKVLTHAKIPVLVYR